MSSCHCSSSTQATTEPVKTDSKTVFIDFLFLDLSVCTRCQDTEESIEDSLNKTTELLNATGYQVKLNKIHIETKEAALKHHFVSSPTIRINGQDMQMEIKESHCSTCSSLTEGASVDCRLWHFQGKDYLAPPKEMIIEAVMKNIYAPSASKVADSSRYIMPNNLIEYFEKKDKLCAAKGSSCC